MKSVIIIMVLWVTVFAQRPGYLAGPTYPELANRFKEDKSTPTSTSPTTALPPSIENKFNYKPDLYWPSWYYHMDHYNDHFYKDQFIFE
ncbi:hypothetical protein RN001_002302 [Aquatica leii]|uniref:Uncharacterized protein n=1 Tax=Aquatica leii TaxID=1421715 RepID=A0AAN7PM82_9COLE|nr:hypothetical protein RN001_002302 [Aquatica leii]